MRNIYKNPSLDQFRDAVISNEKAIICVDIETDGKPVQTATAVGFSALIGNDVFLVFQAQNHVDDYLKVLSGSNIAAYNAVFDYCFFLKAGSKPKLVHDPFLMVTLLQWTELGLKSVHKALFNSTPILLDDVTIDKDFSRANPESGKTWSYMMQDVIMLNDLVGYVETKYTRYLEVYNMDVSLVPILAQERVTGIKIDLQKCAEKQKEFQKAVDSQQVFLRSILGDVKVGSPKVGQILEEKFGIQLPRTPGGKPSASREALEQADIPIAKDIIDCRHNLDILSDLAKMPEYVTKGRIHPDYNIYSLSGSSRLYATKPSITSIPMTLREAIIPDDGRKLVYVDWSAAELIALANMAEEWEIIEVYKSGKDVIDWMRQFFQIPGLEVDREKMKELIYSTLYGSEGGTISRKYNIPMDVARSAIMAFWKRFPKCAAYKDFVHKRVAETGYTRTHFGRPRRLSRGPSSENKVLRQSLNTAIQSTVGDLMRKTLSEVSNLLVLGERIVLQVFDSILFEIEEGTETKEFFSRIDPVVRTTFAFRLSLGEGKSWAEAQSNIIAKRL